VSESNQGGTPPSNPYGSQSPYGQPPAGNPYGQPPQAPQPQESPQPQDAPPPYGQPQYGQPQHAQPQHAQPQYGQPQYGQPQEGRPTPDQYAAPYGQQPTGGPLGDGLDMYGRPLGTDERPGTVTAAGWITLILSGLTALFYAFLTLAIVVAKDEVLREINRALAEQGATGDFDAEDAYGIVVVVLLAFTAWCVIACVLAVFAMRRSTAARILLVISACVAGLISLVLIGSVISGVWLVACVLVVILLFTGGAGDWYARRRRF
jgi:hypothetical protein